jgi:hypothetical protein
VALAVLLIVAVASAAVGAHSMGLFDSLTGSRDSRAASSTKVRVIEGSGYSFEVPDTWTDESPKDSPFDFNFSTPSDSVAIVSAQHLTPSVRLDDPTVLDFLFDTALRGVQVEFSGLALTSSIPYERNKVRGLQVVLSGRGGDGAPSQVIQTVFVHADTYFVFMMIGHGVLADDPAILTEHQRVLESFRFR